MILPDENSHYKNNSKKIYATYSSLASSGISDDLLIQHLLKVINTKQLGGDFTLATLLSDYCSNGEIDLVSIIELIGLTHQKKKEKTSISNTDERKHNGIYYTNYSIARRIAEDTVSLFGDSFDPTKLTFLEPCSGTGIFVIAYLDTVFRVYKNHLLNMQKIINNMFYADIDGEAISLLERIIPTYLKAKYAVDIEVPKKNIYIGNVLFTAERNELSKVNLKSIFNNRNGFDIVLTNPPYKLLKANSNKYNENTDDYKEQVTEILKFIRKNNIYKFNAGTLNLYKLFVEEIVENLTNKEGKVGLLIPSTLLSDKQSFELRSRILNNYAISTIYTIPEKNNFFLDISQAFCFFSLDKSKTSDVLKLKPNISDCEELNKEVIQVSRSGVNAISTLQEIVSTDRMGWRILHKIHKNEKLKEIPSITNLRGELDLTLDKKFITKDGTNFHFLRGNGIKEFAFTKDNSYIQNDFINKLNGKARYLSSERLVCQQVSNINLRKRLKFSKVPKNVVLGNSCNFVVTNGDSLFSESNISLDYLLGVLNSLLLNWRFQLTSSNNHIGNYELDELPLAKPNSEQKAFVEEMVDKLSEDPDNYEYKARLNSAIFNIYDLDKEEALYILNSHKDGELARLTERWLQ